MKKASMNGVEVYPFSSEEELLSYIDENKGILVAINAEKILHATDETRAIITPNVGYCDGSGAVMALKKKGFKDCFEGVPERNTMPESKYYPATCFDYLFIKGSSEFFAPVVSKKQYTSDHKMISVVVRPQDNKTSKNKKEK